MQVVTVNFERVPSKGTKACGKHSLFMAERRWAALTEGVLIDDGDDICKIVERGTLCRFPRRTFRALTVSEQSIDARVDVIEPISKRHAVRCVQPAASAPL